MFPTKPRLLQLYRLALTAGVVWLIHAQAERQAARAVAAPPLEQVKRWFPEAAGLGEIRLPRQDWAVISGSGTELGRVLRTAPATNGITGYAGPNDLLIAEKLDGQVLGFSILHSSDTPDHAAQVARDPDFSKALAGWQPGTQPVPEVAAVSGSTLTSLAMVEAVTQRLGADAGSLRFPEAVTLGEVQAVFPAATAWDGRRVMDVSGKLIGEALRTAPVSDAVMGHGGPTESLIALEPDGRTVREVRLRKSYDTADYTDQVREDRFFLASFKGRRLGDLAGMNYAREGIEGVSGATETSFAVAEGLKRRAALEVLTPRARAGISWGWKDSLLALVIAGAVVLAFTKWRGSRRVRLAWQAVLIGYVGLVSHDLLSLGLLTGWAAHGPAWRSAPGLVLLGAAALLIPWAGGRQIYCHQLCPHGAAQLWLGSLTKRKIAVPPSLGRWLERLPGLLLLAGLASAPGTLPWTAAQLEPFDAWAWRAAGVAVLALAAAGLLASVFVPQAYCRYGCPTGALLKWVRTRGPGDQFSRRDGAALVCLLAAAAWVFFPRQAAGLVKPDALPPPPHQISGRTMGTSWSLIIRQDSPPAAPLRGGLQRELDRVENLLSTWRPETPVSRFNRAAGTGPVPLPDEILKLLQHGRHLSSLTGGAYDLTVGPLVRAWGYGPPPRPEAPPRPDEIQRLRLRTGWEKLTLNETSATRQQPELEIDLTSLAEGWALDAAAHWLREQGTADFLLEVGGELRASGTWAVAVECPMESLNLSSASLSTSGTYRQSRVRGAGFETHLIDPRTGYPVQHRTVSVSVLAADSLTADSWATALNVLGAAEGMPLANRLGLAARFVSETGPDQFRISRSAAWEEKTAAAARGLTSTGQNPRPSGPP